MLTIRFDESLVLSELGVIFEVSLKEEANKNKRQESHAVNRSRRGFYFSTIRSYAAGYSYDGVDDDDAFYCFFYWISYRGA